MKPWWHIGIWQVVWVTILFTVILWHDGVPQGPVDWALTVVALCVGYFGACAVYELRRRDREN